MKQFVAPEIRQIVKESYLKLWESLSLRVTNALQTILKIIYVEVMPMNFACNHNTYSYMESLESDQKGFTVKIYSYDAVIFSLGECCF